MVNDAAYQNACKNSDAQNSRTECESAVKRALGTLLWTDGEVSDIVLLRLYDAILDFSERMADAVFARTYETLKLQEENQEPEKPSGNTVQHRNFRALSVIAPEIVSGGATYLRMAAGEGFMPLSIDVLGRNRIAIAHNYEQNGDLMADPNMEFAIDRDAGTLSARTYQQDGMGIFQRTEDGGGNISNPRLARDLDGFARQWLSNIRAQGYIKERMAVISRGEEIEIRYGADGRVREIIGDTAAIDAYARSIGIEPPQGKEESAEGLSEWRRLREQTGDALLMIPKGGFYEMHGHDARIAANVLGMTTINHSDGAGRVELCGFPNHMLDRYADRLALNGYGVAIAGIDETGALSIERTVDAWQAIDSDEAPPSPETSIDLTPGSENEPGFPITPEQETQYIREVLLTGTGTEGGKERIHGFMSGSDKTGSAMAAFLRNEYGTGGQTMIFSDGRRGYADHGSKGIRIRFGFDTDAPEIKLPWAKTAGMLYSLVQSGEYYTPKPGEAAPINLSDGSASEAAREQGIIDRFSELARDGEIHSFPPMGERHYPRRHSQRMNENQQTLFDLLENIGQNETTPPEAETVPDEPPVEEESAIAEPEAADTEFDLDGDIGGEEEPARETMSTSIPSPDAPKPPNFRITEDTGIGGGGAKTKYRRNVEAIRLLQTIESENRFATPEEQAVLALYSGWGGISQAFKADHPDWQRENAELRELLAEKEYRAAEGSTLNAHYTTPEVISGVYAGLARLGFDGGNVLEPAMGVGNFYGCMPEDMAAHSRLYGVELDPMTGRMAKQLYPNADIQIQGFEAAKLPDSFFDAVVGNVPFGQYKVSDPKFDKYNFLIHDYFIAKSLDKIRPGGIIAVLTSKGTLDKANTSVRRHLAERAELLGAVRLPNTAFKQNAGTEVTSDILFLKKRDRLVDASEEKWVYTGKTEDGIPLNEYYLENPQMMLGTMAWDDRMYGGNSETTLNPDGRDLRGALLAAVEFLPEGAYSAEGGFAELGGEETETIPADPSVKNFCYTVTEDGQIYQRVDSRMEKREFAKTAAERVTGMIELRSLTRHILTSQLEGISDPGLRRLQSELNERYDRFYKKFDAINSRYNIGLFGDDADFPLLSAIEELGEEGAVTKAGIFTKRTISQGKRIARVDTPMEALPVCLNERGYVDIGFMASLSSESYEEVIEDLRGVIFKNPAYDNTDDENNVFQGWETADEYLSGRVKDKLAAAELAAADNPVYAANVEALRAVQPVPLEAHEISARIGAHWIDREYYRQFLVEKLNVSRYDNDAVKVHYTPQTGEWTVERPYRSRATVEASKTYGTARMDAFALMEVTLNQKNARIYDAVTDDEGKEKRVLNHKETIAIRDRQAKLKEEFRRWIFDDPERREKLCAVYNRLFNSERPRKYDGSHLTFPGMSPEVAMDRHQSDGVARILYGGNSLLAHVVGAGKTYTMIAAAMEMKRLGLARKPCFVVPNHLVGQWANAFLQLYPTANILAARKKDFEKQNRRRFCARIATGEWDAVIIGHSSFEKVPVSRERQEDRLGRDISDLEVAIREAKEKDGKSITVKELQRALKNLEFELKRLQDSPKDDLVTFEELGVDALYVDESHFYKNKFIFSKMSNVAGLSKARAKKSTDMDMKCEYINEINGGPRGITFATGTPISNSMVEMFTVQTYLQREELERLGLNHFDNWAADFGEVVSALELAPSGQGYRVRERFAKFVNLPELMAMFRKVADIQTADMLKLPVPEIMDGKPITVAVAPSPELREYTEKLVKRSERIYKREVKPEQDNMLCVTNDGRNAALDMRCVGPNMPDYPDSKANVCARKVFEIYKETEEQRLTQMIFCDLSTPKQKSSTLPIAENVDGTYTVDWDAMKTRPFCVYDDIKAKLVDMGVKPNEIAYIHDAGTDEQKEAMFAAVRRGEIRVIMGSTQKMGAGTNAQTKLIALHHLDCPYRPSDLEQREGRIVRRGNENETVQIYQFVTRHSFDAYLWQIVESKARFIAQVMSGKNPSREMEDIDETVLNYAEVKAIATGNPLIKRKMELDLEVQRLRVLESQYRADRYSLEDAILKRYPARLAGLSETIKGMEADVARRDAHTGKDGEFTMKLGKREFTERKDAGETLLKAIASGQYTGKTIGFYRGFEIIPHEKEMLFGDVKITLKGTLSYTVELSDSDVGSIARIENALNRMEERLADERRDLENTQRQLESVKDELSRPFEQEQQLQTALSELESVNAALDIDKTGDADTVIDENTQKDEDILELDEDSEDEPEM